MGITFSLVSLCEPPPGHSRSEHLSVHPPTLPRCGHRAVPNLTEKSGLSLKGVQLWDWGLPSLCVAEEQCITSEVLFKTREWRIWISVAFPLYSFGSRWFWLPEKQGTQPSPWRVQDFPFSLQLQSWAFVSPHVILWPCFLLPNPLHITTMRFFWKGQLLYNRIYYCYY